MKNEILPTYDNSNKLSEYTINEYSTFQEALQAFQRTFSIYDDRELLSFRYINEKEIIGRLSTSKKSLSPKVKKNLLTGKYFLSFKRAECKYLCSRDYSEMYSRMLCQFL